MRLFILSDMCCDSVGVRGSEKEEEEEMKEGWRPVNASRQIKQINNVKAFMKICCISFSFSLGTDSLCDR